MESQKTCFAYKNEKTCNILNKLYCASTKEKYPCRFFKTREMLKEQERKTDERLTKVYGPEWKQYIKRVYGELEKESKDDTGHNGRTRVKSNRSHAQ
jgi:hypothetical protein